MIAPVASHTSSEGWVPVKQSDESIPGMRYRMTISMKAPYTSENIEKIDAVVRFGTGLRNLNPFTALKEKIEIESTLAKYPKPVAAGRYPVWEYVIIFKKTTKGTPLAVIYGLIAAMITAAILVSIVGYVVEKEGDKIKDVAGSTIFNPFFLVAAVLVVFVMYGRSFTGVFKGGK